MKEGRVTRPYAAYFIMGDGNLVDFPDRCCHHASTLLLLYFSDLEITGFAKYDGINPDLEAPYNQHVWLQNDRMIVDITADQFEGDNLPSVIVTENSDFHKRLNGKLNEPVTRDMLNRWRDYYEKKEVIQRIKISLDRIQQ